MPEHAIASRPNKDDLHRGTDAWSPLEAAPERRATPDWRALHDDEAGALQMFDEALRHDRGHDLVGVVNALAALDAQSERERVEIGFNNLLLAVERAKGVRVL